MGHLITDLKARFKRGDIVIQLIYINVGVFIIISLIAIGWLLISTVTPPFLLYFQLPSSLSLFIRQPWSPITYMFLHGGIGHILFNMLWLYWFGELFLRFFSAKHLRGLYLFGGVCGGILYMLAYTIFPFFHGVLAFLVGASASVLAIVVATAYREPDYRINLLFLGSIPLKYVALFMILLDLLFMTSSNAGGHIAHLGGALAGWMFASQLKNGRDLTLWINKPLDWCMGLFEKKPRSKKAKMKVHYGTRADDYNYNADKKARSEEIDRILDKLRQSGYQSLSAEEKKKLFDASKN